MKKIILVISIALLTQSVKATVIIVTCQNNPSHFLPVTINPVVGDTIHWQWVSGNHVVGPISVADIPVGAAMFNAPIDASHHTFDYVVTVAGNYHYVCHPASPHGEDAYMVVSSPSGIQQNNSPDYSFSLFPNPVSENLSVNFQNKIQFAEINVMNVLGENVFSMPVNSLQTTFNISTAKIPDGIYFINLKSNKGLSSKKVIIQHN